MDIAILVIYLLESAILGITAYTVGPKHSAYPDCSVGYHWKSAEKSAETWCYVNCVAGITSGISAVVLLVAGLAVWFIKPGKVVSVISLLALSAVAVGSALFVPYLLLYKKFRPLYKNTENVVK